MYQHKITPTPSHCCSRVNLLFLFIIVLIAANIFLNVTVYRRSSCPALATNHTVYFKLPCKEEVKPEQSPQIVVKEVYVEKLQQEQQVQWDLRGEIRMEFMKKRIENMKPLWLKTNVPEMVRKMKILVLHSLVAIGFDYDGAPLGEAVTWSDLIAGLLHLGHEVHVWERRDDAISKKDELYSFDLIMTDYIGVDGILRPFTDYEQLKCKLRIMDFFGTQEPYNMEHPNTRRVIAPPFCCAQLKSLKQFYTFVPRRIPDPENEFIGFVMDISWEHINNRMKQRITMDSPRTAYLWTKNARFIVESPIELFKALVAQNFEIHITIPNDQMRQLEPMEAQLRTKFINHGVLGHVAYIDLLSNITVYVGLGIKLGPSSLESIAYGAALLQTKFVPPVTFQEANGWSTKPTNWQLTSQVPLLETVGEPYVYTVHQANQQAVEEALEDLVKKRVENGQYVYLSSDYSAQTYLNRLHIVIQKSYC